MDLKETLKYIKLRESMISMVLGVVVIMVSGIVLINYFAKRTSPTAQKLQIGDEQQSNQTQKTHIIEKGETLAEISNKYFGTPDKLEDIAAANGITNPDNIQEGQTLIIPDVSETASTTPTEAIAIASATPLPKATSVPSAAPTGKTPELTSTPTPTVFTENGEGAASTEVKTHTVGKGETLWKIAEDNYQSGYNWVDISEVNKLSNPNKIEEGQTLLIPNVSAKAKTTGQEASLGSKQPISGASYTVEKGDSLWQIAVRAYGDGYKWVDISRENNISTPNLIHPGNTLTLPR